MKKNSPLIIAHGFNMDGRAASQTVTDKIPYLLDKGCSPIILSAVTGRQDARLRHLQLWPWGPAGLRFDLRHWLRLNIGKGVGYRIVMAFASLSLLPFIVLERLLLGLQSQWSWAVPATARGLWLIWRGEATAIYSSGGAYSAHLAGLWLKRLTGKEWIAEIHDPMVTPGKVPRTRDERFQAYLERMICTHADCVWWFTDGALASARKRNPQLGERGFVVCPGANPPPVKSPYQKGSQLVFAHFGSLDISRSLAPFLEALGIWLAANPSAVSQILVDIYGANLDMLSNAEIEKHGLQKLVNCHGRLEYSSDTGYSGRERVMLKMQEADCLLLMHGCIPECSEYIPSKVYEYFWARRPILGLIHDNSQLAGLIENHGGYVAETKDVSAIVSCVERIFSDWQTGGLETPFVGLPIGVEQAVEHIIEECFRFGVKGFCS